MFIAYKLSQFLFHIEKNETNQLGIIVLSHFFIILYATTWIPIFDRTQMYLYCLNVFWRIRDILSKIWTTRTCSYVRYKCVPHPWLRHTSHVQSVWYPPQLTFWY